MKGKKNYNSIYGVKIEMTVKFSIKYLSWAKQICVIFRATLQGQYAFFPIIITTLIKYMKILLK